MSSATVTLETDWLVESSEQPEDVLDYCRSHDVLFETRETLQLAHRYFPMGSTTELRIERDPESDESWLLMVATVFGTVELAMAAYLEFVEKWVEVTPSAARDRIRIAVHIA